MRTRSDAGAALHGSGDISIGMAHHNRRSIGTTRAPRAQSLVGYDALSLMLGCVHARSRPTLAGNVLPHSQISPQENRTAS